MAQPPHIKTIDLSPVYGPAVYRDLDLDENDPIVYAPYKTLIEEQKNLKLPYILAIIQDVNNCTTPIDAISLWRWKVEQKQDTNPKTTNLIKKVFYYTIQNLDDNFEYLGNSEEIGRKADFLNKLLDPQNLVRIKQRAFALILDEKLGIHKNYPHLAFEYYKRAAENSDDLSDYFNLAQCYEEGPGVDVNPKKSFKYYKRAADLGDAESQYQVGIRYRDGLGIDKDLKLSINYLQMAANAHYDDAADLLRQVKQEASKLEWTSRIPKIDKKQESSESVVGTPLKKRKRAESPESSSDSEASKTEIKKTVKKRKLHND